MGMDWSVFSWIQSYIHHTYTYLVLYVYPKQKPQKLQPINFFNIAVRIPIFFKGHREC